MSAHPRCRGPRWERLARGVAIPAGLDGDPRWWASLSAWADVLPASYCFTGLTAARAHGLWLPPVPDDLPLSVAVGSSAGHARRELRMTRHPAPVLSVEIRGIRVATVPELLIACARDLGLLDLVVLVDSALHLQRCTLEELHTAGRRRRRGAPQLREALRWCDGRSESPWETLLRMLHTVCGVAVEPQVELLSVEGRFLGRADLLVAGTRTLQEYDGDDHFQRGRYGRDRRRDPRLGKAGYVRNGWVAHQVLHDGWLILKEAWEALGREPSIHAARPWFSLLDGSLFSRPGTAELRRRWGLDR